MITRLPNWAFHVLLRAYPEDFRAAYGREMLTVIADMKRDMKSGSVRLYSEMVFDMLRAAIALRIENFSRRHNRKLQNLEGVMIIMAILAIAIGAIEAVNSLQEVWVHGALNSGWALTGGIIGAAAGLLLLISGMVLLRRPKTLALANVSAVACLSTFILVGVLRPQMSIFATILGIGFPLALLAFLYWSKGRPLSRPSTI